MMMQKKYAKDYVISTGNQYTIKEFINLSAKYLRMKITWKGKGLKEKAYWNNKEIISIDKIILDQQKLSRCLGSKFAKKELKWRPKYNINSLISEMIEEENKKLNKPSSKYLFLVIMA